MHEPNDIARSIRRYLSLMWAEGSGWTIRTERREVKDDSRPIAVVLLGTGRILKARTSINQGQIEESFPVTVYAYPELGEDEALARAAGDRIAAELKNWIALGLIWEQTEEEAEEEADPPEWTKKSAPFRIPLWDYADTPETGPKRAGPEKPHDVIWVDPESVDAQNLEDPEDGKRRAVTLEFRISIERPGRIGPTSDVSGLEGAYTTTDHAEA